MIKLTKTSPLPDGVDITSHTDWAHGSRVRALLEADCYGKCYICEDKPKDVASLTVDHVVSRDSNPTLEFAWNNLLLACACCNNRVKGHGYNDIINPSSENEPDPETVLVFGLSYDNRRVEITCLSADAKTAETKTLLDEAYRVNIKAFSKMVNEIREFNYYLNAFKSGDSSVSEYIRESVSRASAFAAFKRKIVKDDPELSASLASVLE